MYSMVSYIPRCRSLHYLHNRGPKVQGCVNCVETEPRYMYITDLYHGLRSHNNKLNPIHLLEIDKVASCWMLFFQRGGLKVSTRSKPLHDLHIVQYYN
jgi:uncharacterized protein (DUF488 family)